MSDRPDESFDRSAFEDLFDLDARVVAIDDHGRCTNHTDDTCSQSCPSVGCSATCHCR